MDHWGDPWADDADTKPPTKEEEIKTPPPPPPPPPPPIATAPVILNGFLDDAQWGSVGQDDGFGAWAASPQFTDSVHAASSPETREPEPRTAAIESLLSDTPCDAEKEQRHTFELEDEGWGKVGEEEPALSLNSDNVVSEASDSATTVQPDDVPTRGLDKPTGALGREDDLSTRPSTSPSDVSHTEAPSESPRTSFEDERGPHKPPEVTSSAVQEEDVQTPKPKGKEEPVRETKISGKDGSDEDDFGDFEDDHGGIEAELQDGAPISESPSSIYRGTSQRSMEPAQQGQPKVMPIATIASIPGLDLDLSLMEQLFPSQPANEPSSAPDDPIYSTSARKAWYRLTRKQTMREFNHGDADDNYVRVTWANSRIRQDANKIVARWASEDRISGRGASVGGFFSWDRPASGSKGPAAHMRKKSSISASSSIRPAKQNVSPLNTNNAPAAFAWSSSPLVSSDHWKQDSSATRSASSPVTIKNKDTSVMQRKDPRSVSVDLTSGVSPQSNHKKTASSASTLLEELAATPPVLPSANSMAAARQDIQNTQAPLPTKLPPSPAQISKPPKNLGPLRNFGALDTSVPTKAIEPPSENVATDDDDDDDDDEWGDMVQSPTVSSPVAILDSFQTPARTAPASTPSSTPQSIRNSPNQPLASRHASPLVRLKGVVSPTSANFKFNSFVPENAVEEPIGPGLLKPTKRSVNSIPGKTGENAKITAIPSGMEVPVPVIDESEDFTPFASNTAASNKSGSSLTSPSADFNTFESSISEPVQRPNSTTQPGEESTPTVTSVPPSLPPSHPTPNPQPSAPEPQLAPQSSLFDVDFSIFESALAPPTQPQSQRQTQTFHPDPSDPFSIFETAIPVSQPKQNPTPTSSAQRKKAQEDAVIREIVWGLPDLGYMLQS